MKSVVATWLMAMTLWMSAHAATGVDVFFRQFEPWTTVAEFDAFLTSLEIADAGDIAAAREAFAEFDRRHQGRAREVRSAFEGAKANQIELICAWQSDRVRLQRGIEAGVAAALGDEHAAAWQREASRCRRRSLLPEIKGWSHQTSLVDVGVLLDSLELTEGERAALAEPQAAYEAEMDTALRAWEDGWPPLLTDMYGLQQRRDAIDAAQHLKEWQDHRDRLATLAEPVRQVNLRWIDALASALDDENRERLHVGVHASDDPKLYVEGPVDAIRNALTDLAELDEGRRKAINEALQAYFISRRNIREKVRLAAMGWTAQDAAKAEEKRAALLEARASPWLAYADHPTIPHLEALATLEEETLWTIRRLFSDEEFGRLPLEFQVLLFD